MQLAKGNNGLVKTKYITFGIKAENLRTAKARLKRIETDILNNFKVLGAAARPLNGVERLKILHDILNMDTKETFRFHYGMVAKTGLGTKDFIAPTGFDFRNDSYFRMGQTFGCVSYLQITSPELTDKMLADFLDMEENLIVNILNFIRPHPGSAEDLMQLFFWLDEENRDAVHLFVMETGREKTDADSYNGIGFYPDAESRQPAVGIRFGYGKMDEYLGQWMEKKRQFINQEISEREYLEWKWNWPITKRSCHK